MISRIGIFAVIVVVILFLPCALLFLIQENNPFIPGSTFDMGPVKAGDAWGRVETFNGAETGTTAFHDVIMFQDQGNEAVVLGGSVWIMSKMSTSNKLMMKYTPPISGNHTTFSFEAYAPRDYQSWKAANKTPGKFALDAYLIGSTGTKMDGVELSVGNPNTQKISFFSGSTGQWNLITTQVLPACPRENNDYGSAPDRYIVSLACDGLGVCKITIWHTLAGKVFSNYIRAPLEDAKGLEFYFDSDIVTDNYGNDLYSGWMVDNLACRGASARYPVVGPVFENVRKDAPLWITVATVDGGRIPDAVVSICGIEAKYNTTNQRYEAMVSRNVDWSREMNYSVTVDGVVVADSVRVTTLPVLQNCNLPLWWNGWDWVSVFGEDDCSGPQTAANNFAAYNHPYTAYLLGAQGNSEDILSRQSEIALHYPHLWNRNSGIFWNDALQAACEGHDFLSRCYEFASRWDDPSYVGCGDTYIGFAYPGNSGDYQYEYALYEAGTRIGGICSHPAVSPGNASLLGSWWPPESSQWTGPSYSWYPDQPMDLLDAARHRVDLDSDVRWSEVKYIADRNGVLRLYNHPLNTIESGGARDILLRWIDEPKSNYSLENWKATDGEVASYVYGRSTTDVRYNQSSSSSVMIFDVSRKDPHEAGYWLVPVTVAVDTHGRMIKDIQIVEGNKTYSAINGTLRNLDGKRIMDVGYDVRGSELYVSHFWNRSSVLKIVYAELPTRTPLPADSYFNDPLIAQQPVLDVPLAEIAAAEAFKD